MSTHTALPKTLPLVSIITATYNRAPVLKTAIDSVFLQTYKNIEYILIDDGSTDSTKELVQTYSAQQGPQRSAIMQYHFQTNQGQASALNLGLEKASGEFVAFLDSDDSYKPDHIQHLFEFLTSHQVDLVIGNFDIIGTKEIPMIVDYFNHSRTIPLTDIDCCTGIMFGKKSVFLDSGGFVGEFADIQLFEKMKSLGVTWKRSYHKTYEYNYGRCNDSILATLTKERGH